MVVNVYGKQVEIREEFVKVYDELLHEPITDMVARYLAESSGCTEDMSEKEIARKIERNILEHVDIYRGASQAISKLEIKDGEFVFPEVSE